MNIVKFALKKGADNVVVEKIKERTKQVRFANSSVSIFNNWNMILYKIFLSWKGRTVNTVVDDVSENSIKKKIEEMLSFAKFLKPNENFSEIAKGPFRYKPVSNIYDKKIEDIDETDLINSTINAALEKSKKTAGSFYTSIQERELETSSDVSALEKSTSIQISIRAFNEDDETGHSVSCSRILKEFKPEEAGRESGEISYLSKNPKNGKSGKFDVVFNPLAAANLIALVGSSASVFYVESGLSFLKDKIEKKVGSDVVSLIDDSTVKNGFASRSFDEEGVPSKKTEIIKNGILKTYLHNTSTAKKYKTKTTASAGLIFPSPQNIILSPGKIKDEEIFKGVKNGIYITNVWYTRFQNYMSGDFSTIPRDGIFSVENGEIAGSLKNIRVSENLQRIFLNIKDISNKSKWIQWWGLEGAGAPVFSPFILIKDVNITLPTM